MNNFSNPECFDLQLLDPNFFFQPNFFEGKNFLTIPKKFLVNNLLLMIILYIMMWLSGGGGGGVCKLFKNSDWSELSIAAP